MERYRKIFSCIFFKTCIKIVYYSLIKAVLPNARVRNYLIGGCEYPGGMLAVLPLVRRPSLLHADWCSAKLSELYPITMA